VCCESACDGACVSCNGNANQSGQSGKCGPVTGGTDPRNACNKDDASPCGKPGVCGDDGECQAFASAGTLCGAGACEGDSLTRKECDGFGACQQLSSLCPPFACDEAAKACKTKCSSDQDCSTGAVCATNGQCTLGEASCSDKSTARAADGSLKKCDPYTCLNGQCRSSCSSDLDCVGDFECNGQQCVAKTPGTGGNAGASGSAGNSAGGAGGEGGVGGSSVGGSSAGGAGGNGTTPGGEVSEEDGGCGCRTAGNTSPSGRGAVVGVFLALAAVARRRRLRV
jgi:MYXO-CTERM domain-containing protein